MILGTILIWQTARINFEIKGTLENLCSRGLNEDSKELMSKWYKTLIIDNLVINGETYKRLSYDKEAMMNTLFLPRRNFLRSGNIQMQMSRLLCRECYKKDN